jgi:hypothetical protein
MPAPLACFLDFFGHDDRFAELRERLAVVGNPVAQQSRSDVGIDIRSDAARLLRREEPEMTERCRARGTRQPCVEFSSLHGYPLWACSRMNGSTFATHSSGFATAM